MAAEVAGSGKRKPLPVSVLIGVMVSFGRLLELCRPPDAEPGVALVKRVVEGLRAGDYDDADLQMLSEFTRGSLQRLCVSSGAATSQ